MGSIEYEPPYVHNETGERGATVISVDTGKHANIMTMCALVCGICVALAVVCAGICWWAITEHRVVLNHYMQLEAAVEELKHGQR